MGKGIVISLLIMGIGVAWLLTALHVISGVDWIWTIALGGAGLLLFAWAPFNKVTFIIGTFLITGSIFSVIRQAGLMTVDVEVPVLVIVFGLIALVAQMPMIPHPRSVLLMKEEEARQPKV